VLCGGMLGGARGRWQGKLNPSSVVSDIIDSEADNKFSVCFLLATLFDQACSFVSLLLFYLLTLTACKIKSNY